MKYTRYPGAKTFPATQEAFTVFAETAHAHKINNRVKWYDMVSEGGGKDMIEKCTKYEAC